MNNPNAVMRQISFYYDVVRLRQPDASQPGGFRYSGGVQNTIRNDGRYQENNLTFRFTESFSRRPTATQSASIISYGNMTIDLFQTMVNRGVAAISSMAFAGSTPVTS